MQINRLLTHKHGMAASFVALMLLIATSAVVAAGDGTVTSLTSSDAPGFNQAVTISATFLANTKINNSNVAYTILAPDGVTVVTTHNTFPPDLDVGQSFSDSWTTLNTSFPSSGTYTLRACWNNGGSNNCQIASATTTFFSVPTMGVWLTLAGLTLLVSFLWQRRDDFGRPIVESFSSSSEQAGETPPQT